MRRKDETPALMEPIEDVDYFAIKQLRYELHVEGTIFITADEECDDFGVDATRIDLSAPTVVSTTMIGSEERRIDDPTKPFDRKAWTVAKRIELGEYVRPHEKTRHRCETTLADFQPPPSLIPRILACIDGWLLRTSGKIVNCWIAGWSDEARLFRILRRR